ncbi:TonB-dependent receptor [Cellvibrio sp. QJXJ]|uniref:TonB-dependent receptor n=1 Tax=Cellvibrio sp. QJXJ TaxID=2964606 RepID=UPI0021C455B6|nr:TonB-dependent receptor [Cellvibrio sp. QJXJ]UUA73360.1 TonB-dependent receptor [Cellvibrio sp. QJXJ]
MQNPINFKRKIMATAVASVMAAGFSSVAMAQDNALEEVIVTGIKASLQASMDVKREAVGVVDAISAEDIGKMPDTNLAESLQRIPGVSIDRVNGEGSKVTVRGLSGDYNLVTLNSRQMPASSFGTSRSFDFANLASEGVSGVQVYKSGRADVQSGGMGALINIVTPRPLSSPGLKAVLGGKAVYDDSSVMKDDLTPEVSGLFSNTFADDTIGVALTGSYQERNSGDRNASVSDWFVHATDGGDWAGIPAEHQPGDGRTYAIPSEVMYSVNEVNRKRLNSQLTLQYQPIEQLTVTADYLYVTQQNEVNNFGTGFWFTRDNDLDIEWSDTNPAYPLSYTENSGRHEINSIVKFNKTKSNLKSSGLNVKWDATDNLELEFDAHNSTSLSGPNGKWGGNNQFNFGSIDNYRVSMDFSGKFPVMNRIGHEDGRTNVAPDISLMQLTNNIFRIQEQDSSVDEYQLKGTYNFDDSFIDNIKAGVGTNEITNKYFFLGYQAQNQGSWSGVQGENGVGDIPRSYWIVDKLSNYFDHDATNGANFQNSFVRGKWDELLAVGADLYGSDTGHCIRAYCTTRDPALANDGLDDQTTVETSDFAYLQFGFKPEIAGMPANLAVGVRHETTDVESTAYVSAYTPYIRWNSGNEYSLIANGSEYGVTTGSYSKTLPNLDFDIALTDDIKARASFSKTISRPNYNDLKGGFVWGTAPRVSMGSASAGDPDLNPMESTNFDLSAEWYYADSSYVSLGFFKKDVVDFIGSSAPVTITDSGFHTPVGGPRWNAAVAAVGNNLTAINEYIVANYPGSVDAANNHVFALPEDPILPFEVTRPINNEDVAIDGIEIAVQHSFGESGYGFQANVTKVDSDTEYNNVSKASQFAIYGLSDSANLIGFYDKDGLQVRIAYNWRDDFLAGGGGNPRYTEAYGQVDASVSYELTDNLTLSLEGLNITNETTRQYGRHENMTFNYIETGARYNLGARYSF